MNFSKTGIIHIALFLVSVLLSACGGGGGGAATNPTIISGVASKGPLNGSTVCAYAIAAGAKGAALGSCATNIVNGNYSIDIGAYTGPVLFEATGGTYTDEATGTTVALASPLRSMLSNAAGSSTSVAVTPLTELAYQLATAKPGNLTNANIQAAITSVQTSFSVADIIYTNPVDALNVPPGASAGQKTYALALATISQYQKNQPAGTSVADSLQTIQACLAASTSCGTGATSVGVSLNVALYAFQADHTAFSGTPSPVLLFGAQPIGDYSGFPVNELYAAVLISKGMPEDIARFFAAAKLSSNCTGGMTCTYLYTYPNGSTRNITLTATANQQYTPTADELASAALVSNPVYDGKFSVIGIENSTPPIENQVDIGYFVPTTSIPKSPAAMAPALSLTAKAARRPQMHAPGVNDGVQINWAEIGGKGADFAIGSTLEYYKIIGQTGAGAAGALYSLASAANDIGGAVIVSDETKAWMAELDALEKCANDPSNPLSQSDPTYSSTTVANLQATRAEIKLNSAVRFLNMMGETAMGITPETAALAIPLKQVYSWNDQTLKNLSEKYIRDARKSVVSCIPTAPTNVVVTPVSETQLDISWSGSTAFNDVTKYEIFRNDGIYQNSSTATAWSDYGLKPSTEYCYRISAYNKNGTSGKSAQACGRTKGPPTVYATNPLNNATNVAVNSTVTATFSEAMDATTISTGTFTLSGVAGTVTYSGLTATFTPSADLEPATTYTATITTGVKDLDGSAMAQSYTWSFTTGGNVAGNLQFVLTGGSGQYIKGSADITWNLRSDSNFAIKKYWPTGTITVDIAREDCDPVHVTKPISPTNMDTPYDATDDGGGLDVYSSMSFVFPNTYWFWLHTDNWDQTFQCGNPRQPTTSNYSLWLEVGTCTPGFFIPYTDAARLTGSLSCAKSNLGGMGGTLDTTWDFKDLK